MKIKVLTRSEREYARNNGSGVSCVRGETSSAAAQSARNHDPRLHPMERAREYKRALNAAKVERMLARPFVSALEGHADGVYCMARNPRRIADVATGGGDGELRMWRLSRGDGGGMATGDGHACVWRRRRAHKGMITGMAAPSDSLLLTCGGGTDKTAKLWRWGADGGGENENREREEEEEEETGGHRDAPLAVFYGRSGFAGIDCPYHALASPQFVTCGGPCVELWDRSRSEPVQRFEWSAREAETVASVRYNTADPSLLAGCVSDRSIVLYDVRQRMPVRKLVLALRSNCVAWNPTEPFTFTAASDDHNCYTFDIRRFDSARKVHRGHVGAVLSVDYAPTGREFCTGSYDRTVRIFERSAGDARETYHTKRMQRVFCSVFSADAAFVLSGSDDGSARLWKARGSQPLRQLLPRERQALDEAEALKHKFAHVPQVRRMLRQRHLPRPLFHAARQKREEERSRARKERNRRKNSARGAVPYVAERRKHVVREDE